MESCSLFAVTNLAGFGDSPKFLKYCNKVGTANSERDPNYLQYIYFKKKFFLFFFDRLKLKPNSILI